MATKFVQGRTYNHLSFAMVDSVDFATPESALSAALKIKVYGTLETATGINFVSSGTGSLTNDIVHVGASVFGLYHIALAKADLSDASAAWYDEYIVVLSAPGAAQQILVVEGVRTDTSYMSNVLSHLSAVASDVYSALTIMQSRVLLNQSRISDTYSMLTTMSDILSNVNSMLIAGTFTLGNSNTSDVASAVWGHTIGARVDSRVLLNQSRISDTQSTLAVMSDILSNVNSMLVAGTFAMGASNLSDIGSAVWAQHWTGHSLASSFGSAFEKLLSAASDAQSATAQINSRVLLNQSRLSDVYSLLSDAYSDLLSVLGTTGVQLNASTMSDLRSAITAAPPLTVSDISDIASAVWATPLATKLVQLNPSDLSDLRSAIAAVTATLTASDISDIVSAVRVNLASDLSDILSAAQQGNSRILVVQSQAGNTYSLLSDAHSDLLSLLTATGVQLNASVMSDLRSAITAVTVTLSVSDISDIASAVWATPLATKLVQLNPSDLSDLRSAIAGVTVTLTASDISDIASAVRTTLVSDLSDILSAAQQGNSRVLVNQSRISDTYSLLTTMSGVLSNVNSMLAAGTFVLGASNLSDIGSTVWAQHWNGHSLASSFGSAFERLMSGVSDAASATTQMNSRVLLNQSRISDVYSLLSDAYSDLLSVLGATGVQLNASTMSDLRSAIAAVTATLTASDISDIVSAVRINLASDLSDILSAAQQGNSRALVNQSRISDVYSLLSDAYSDLLSVFGTTGVQLNASMLSDLRSAIAAGPAGALTVSDISDIASAVWATPLATKLVQLNSSDLSDLRSAISAGPAGALTVSDISDIASAVRAILVSDLSDILSAAQQGNSRTLVVQSRLSDVYSLLSDAYSDLLSVVGTTGVALNASTLSDLRSAITATTFTLSSSDLSDIASAVRAVLVSDLSDILSAAQQGNSRALVVQSRVSDIYSLLSDVSSDLLSVLGTTGVALNASTLSDLRSAITATIFTLSASDLSDIASAVRGVLASDLSDILSAAQQTNSRALVVQSQASDIYSLLGGVASTVSDTYSALSAFESDFGSRFPAAIPELAVDPGATPTWAQANALQYMWLKNNTKSTNSKRFLRNSAGTTVLSATLSDDTVSFVQGKLG